MRALRPRQNHVIGLLGLLVFAGMGCGGGGGHGTRTGGTYNATLSMPWAIYDVSDTTLRTPLVCANVGAGDVVLTSLNNDTNQTFTDTFYCSNNGGTTDYLPAGNYTFTIQLYGDTAVYGNNSTLLDQYAWTQAVVPGTNSTTTAALMVNSYVLGWTITSGGLATSCAAVGATYVALDIYYPNQPQPTTYFLTCAAGVQATLAIPMGTYTIQWQAFLDDASKRDLTQGTTMATYTVRNEDPGRVQADLGTVYFPF